VSSLNKIILLGTVLNKPEIRETTNGNMLGKFSLEVSRPERFDGIAAQKDTIPIITWGQIAEQVKTVNSGAILLIEGKIITKTLDDPSGKRKWLTEVDARHIKIVTSNTKATIDSGNQNLNIDSNETITNSTLEELPTKTASFDFEESNDKESNVADNFPIPPSFTEEVEDDIPF
jgi:single-strand DNA-binding protein